MEKSLFYGWLQVAFGPMIQRFVETFNGVEGAEPEYLFTRYLGKQYSVDLKWGSINSENSRVAADVVALDASVPLKSRESFGTAEGEVPKMGMKYRKSEREMQEIKLMEAKNINGSLRTQILTKLFNDPLRVVRGIYERNEYMFLEGLSTGYATVSENVNEGIALRASYGYNPDNISGVPVAWSDPTADPVADIDRIKAEAKAKGRRVTYMLMEETTANNFRNKQSVKELYAAKIGFYGENLPTPDYDQTQALLASNRMPQIVLMDKTVTIEKNAKRVDVNPWAPGAVVFTDTLNLGNVVWSELVETGNRKQDVLYAVANDYILVSEWHTNDPFSEIVSSQALCIPVIDDPLGKWVLNTETVQPMGDPEQPLMSNRSIVMQSSDEDPFGKEETKGKGKAKGKGGSKGNSGNKNKGGVQNNAITYNGAEYKPQHIRQALNETGEGSKLKGNQKNETLETRISELTPEGRVKFETFLTSKQEENED